MKKIKSLLKKLNSQDKTTKEDAGRDYLAEQLEPRVLYSGTVAPDVSADDQPVQEAPSTPDNQPEAIGADGAPATAIEAAQQASAEMQQFVSEGIQIASGETDLSEDQAVVLLNPEMLDQLGGSGVGALTQEVAAGVLDAAAERWSVSGVLTDQQADALGDFSVQVADLEGDLLLSVSEDNSTIVLDIDAAGREWFVDGSPLDDSEFTDRVSLNGFRADSGAAVAGIDVLTVLMESQGRLLGLDSVSVGRDVSATGIEDGLRRIPFADESLTNPDVVTASLVSDLANAAAQRWEDSGLDAAQIEALVNIEYRVVDLESGVIGAAENGVISIDIDAAGKGWFVDLSPQDDREFSEQVSATALSASEGAAAEGIDLLSVIMHEQGHILGLEHVEDSTTVTIMTDLFSEGDRRLLEDGEAEGAIAGSLDGVHLAHSGLTTMTGTLAGSNGEGRNSWNNDSNWSVHVPSGTDSATVADGVFADVWNNLNNTPTYSGGLTLGVNSTLQIGWTTQYSTDGNALGTGTITLNNGSQIIPRSSSVGNYTFNQQIVMAGDGIIWGGISTSNHHTTKNFNGAISGPGQLTLEGVNNNTFNLNVANTMDGFVAKSTQNQGFRVEANAAGALGVGDVTIDGNATLQIDAANVIDDGAQLSLNGTKDSRRASKLIINANDTVDTLFIDGVQAFAGTYTAADGDWISGSGTLTVTNGAADAAPTLASSDFVDDVFGGPIYEDFTSVTFEVTFSDDMDASTVTAADFSNAGSATISIASVTKTVTPSLPTQPSSFTIVVNPSGTGTIQLQVNAGADLRDVGGNALDTTSAIADDTTITINPGNTPPSEITGTTGGSDSWNTASNWDTNTVPFGPGGATVDAGVTAQVSNAATPAYEGTLTLEAGSTLRINNGNSIGVLQTPSDIVLEDGATIDIRDGSPDVGPIQIKGSTSIEFQSNGAHHETLDFLGAISGTGSLSLNGLNNDTFDFEATNTFEGGLVASSSANQGFRVNARADGAFGTGDVTINNAGTLEVVGSLGDVIGDDAALNLNGVKDSRRASKLILGSDETVAAFFIEGVDQGTGTFGAIGSGADTELAADVLSGSGILTVQAPTGSISAVDDDYTTSNPITEDDTLTIAASGVLANDSPVDAPIVGIQGTTSLTGISDNGAAVTVNADGSFTYDPTAASALQDLNDGDSLTDQFTYAIAGEETALLYDGFDYAAGGIEGENGGIGFAGAWDAPRNNPVVEPVSKDFGGLVTTGGHLRGPAWANMTRPIGTTLSDAGLMDDGSTLWFSVVVDLDGQNLTNADLNFALGTDPFESGVFGDRQNLIDGEAIGFGHNRGTIQGVYWQNTDADAISERNATNSSLVLNNSDNSRALIVGKIDWGNGATADETLTLFAPGTDLALGTQILSITTPALNQSVFDSVLVQFKDRPQIDEIRFGASYDDVNGPETATATVSVQVTGVTDAVAVAGLDAVDDIYNGAGDISIFTEVGGSDAITTAEFAHDFDTTVRSSGSHTLSGSDITLSEGHHLVLYNSRFDATSNNNRREVQTNLNLDGTDLAAGWSQGYVRWDNGQQETVTSGGAIIEANDGDVLQLQSFRTDNNASRDLIREPGNTGIQLIKLDDAWDYARLSLATNQTGPSTDAFVAVAYDTQEELDTDTFGHDASANAEDITLKEAGKYLVFANTFLNETQDRTSLVQRLTLDGAEVPGSKTTVYIRGNQNGASDGAASIGMILETTSANQVLNVEGALDVNRTSTYIGGQTGITIVKLPDTADYIRLSDTSGDQDLNTAAVTPLNYDDAGSQIEVDSAFTHSTTADSSRINVTQDDDYLFLASQYDANDGVQRGFYNQGWQVNGTGGLEEYGQTGRYSRSAGGADQFGNWSGFVTDLNAGDYVETVTQALANGGTNTADTLALQGVRLGSLFRDVPSVSEDDVLSVSAGNGVLPNDSGVEGTPAVILATDFAGRTVSGDTAANITWTTNGIADPGGLTAIETQEGDAGNQLGGLFDTATAQSHFAPNLNTDNEDNWSVSIPLVLTAASITIDDVVLDGDHFSNTGAAQGAPRDTDFIVSLTGSSSGVVASETKNTGNVTTNWALTFFDTASPIRLDSSETWTLTIATTNFPNNSGNNTGLDGLTVNGSFSKAGISAYDAISAKGAAVTVNPDGSFTYDPTNADTLQALAVGENTTDTFTYTIAEAANPDLITTGFDFNLDAGEDTDNDNIWEDTTAGNPSGFEGLLLDDSPAVTRVTGTSGLRGITAAYDFPGGSTGQEAGARPVRAGETTPRSFQEATGDWSNEDVSIEIWFKPDNIDPTPANGQILFEDGGGTGYGFFINDNELQLRKAPGGGIVSYNLNTDPSGLLVKAATEEFIQVVGTYDVSAGSMELFINGTSIGTATPGGNDWSGGDAAGIGTRADSNTGGIGNGQANTESFDGQIGIVRVYRNQILTEEEVGNNFEAVAPPSDTATVTIQVEGQNDAPDILTEVTVDTTTGIGGVSGAIQKDGIPGDFGDASWHVKNTGAGNTTRKGYVRLDISDADFEVTEASLELQIASIQDQEKILSVYGITDESLDLVSLDSSTTWSNAPANDPGSDFAPDLTKAVLLGTFTVPSDAAVGDTVTFSSQELANLVNDDTNGLVTLILGRTGGNTTRNFLPAGDAHPSLDPPTLRLSAGSVLEGSIVESVDVPGGTDPDPAEANGTIVFADVDLTDTHTAAVVNSTVSGGSATLTSEQETALLNSLSLEINTDSTGTGTGELEWTYSVPNSDIDFLSAGETVELTHTVSVVDQNSLVNGLEGHWALDSATDGTDLSGNDRDLTLTGVADAVGQIDGALDLDAGSDRLIATGYQGITGNNPRTLSAWVKTTDNDAIIMSWGVNTTADKWVFRLNDNAGNGTVGALRVEINGAYVIGNTAVNDGNWHHVAMTFDGAAGASGLVDGSTFYVDGNLDADSSNFSGQLSRAVTTAAGQDVEIGGESTVGSRNFLGQIDDAAIWSRDLSSEEIALVASGGLTDTAAFQASDTETVTITITGANDAPVANDDVSEALEDGPAIEIDVLANDSDVDGQSVAIVNGSFESNASDFGTFPGRVGAAGNPAAIDGWTSSGTSVGINPVAAPDGRAPFRDNGDNATNVAFIQGTGSISQDISGLVVGETYELTFDYNERSTNGGGTTVTATIGGETFTDPANNPVGGSNPYHKASLFFTATATTETLTISSASNGGDQATLLDNVSIVRNVLTPGSFITSVDGATGLVTINDNGTPTDGTDDFLDYDPNGQFESLAKGENATDTFTYSITDGVVNPDLVTAGATLNFDASADDGSNNVWESTTANQTRNWALGGNISRTTTLTGNPAGITAAYDFPTSGTNAGGDKGTAGTYDSFGSAQQDATFELWVKADELATNQIIWETGGSGDGASISLNSNGELQFIVKNGANSDAVSAAFPDTTDFHQIVAVYNRDNPASTNAGTGDTLSLYIDGILVAGGPGSGQEGDEETAMHDYAGGDGSGLGGSSNGQNQTGGSGGDAGNLNYGTFDGQIGIMRFYENKALDDAEVENNFTAVTGASDTATVEVTIIGQNDAPIANGDADEIILIDYDDGLANGIHDAVINDGEFTTTTGAGDPWVSISGGFEFSDSSAPDAPTGSERNFVTTGGRVLGLDTGHTIVAGESYDFSYQWIDKFNFDDGSDTVQMSLFFTADDQIGSAAVESIDLNSGLSTSNNTWETSASSGEAFSTAAAGRTLFVRLSTTAGTSEFARFDNIYLKAVVPSLITEDASNGATETDSGTIGFSDVDLTDTHTVTVLFDSTTSPDGQLGDLTAMLATDTTGTGTGGQVTWDYSVDNADIQFLADGETITETYTVVVSDREVLPATEELDAANGANSLGVTLDADTPLVDATGSSLPALITKAYELDGTAGLNRGDFRTDPSRADLEPVTLEFWIKPDVVNQNQVILDTGGSGTGASVLLNSNGTVSWLVKEGGAADMVTTTTSLTAGEWVQIAVTYDKNSGGGTSDLMAIYLNGELEDRNDDPGETPPTALNSWSGTDNGGIGVQTGTLGGEGSAFLNGTQADTYGFLDGQVGIVRFYQNQALTEDQVCHNYEALTSNDTETVTVTITGTNDAPEITATAPTVNDTFDDDVVGTNTVGDGTGFVLVTNSAGNDGILSETGGQAIITTSGGNDNSGIVSNDPLSVAATDTVVVKWDIDSATNFSANGIELLVQGNDTFRGGGDNFFLRMRPNGAAQVLANNTLIENTGPGGFAVADANDGFTATLIASADGWSFDTTGLGGLSLSGADYGGADFVDLFNGGLVATTIQQGGTAATMVVNSITASVTSTTSPAVELTETDSPLTTNGLLIGEDVDVTDVVTAEVDTVTVVSGSNNGITNADLLAMMTVTPDPVIDNGETKEAAEWTFDSGAETFDYLAEGESLVLDYEIKVTDENLLEGGNFDSSADLANWTVGNDGGGANPVLSGNAFGLAPHSGANYLAFGGNDVTENGFVEQTVNVEVGEDYELSFYWSGRGNPGAQVTVSESGAQFGDQEFTNATVGEWVKETIRFTATSSSVTIRFQETSNNSVGKGPAIDSVTLTGIDTETVTITINGTNDVPVHQPLGDQTINENGTVTINGTIVDPDLSDTHTVVIDWQDPNDGDPSDGTISTYELVATNLLPGTTHPIPSNEGDGTFLTITSTQDQLDEGIINYQVSRQYLDDGLSEANFNSATPAGNATASDVSAVTVEVTDNNGASGTAGFNLTVSNVIPVLTNVAVTPDVINENGSVTVTGTIIDPGTLDAFQLTITWGDGKSDTITLDAGSTSFSVDHVYDAGGRSYTIDVRLLDDDLGLATTTLDVRVINVPPALEVNAIPDVVVGETSVLSGSFTDPGIVSPHTLVVDWGDGTSSTFVVPATNDLEVGDRIRGNDGSILTITGVDTRTGEVEFTITHDYAEDGIFNVSVSVSDGTFTVTAQLTATVFLIGPTDTTPGIFTNQPGENNLVGILSIFRDLGDTGLFVGFHADDAEDDRMLDGIMSEEGTPDFLGDLTLAPFFAGTTNPGATAVILIKDEVGTIVAQTTVIADMAGNWTATFPELELEDGDFTVEVQVTNPVWSAVGGSLESQIATFNGAVLGVAQEFSGLAAGQIIGIVVDSLPLYESLGN